MDRQLIYPGAVPLETDLLNAQKNSMIGLSKLIAAIFGTTTKVNGLACNPNIPAAMNVVVSPGEIYSLQNIDGTAYSSLAADTAHQIVKQGILLDAVTLACPAPVTVGYSVNYLIEATYSDVDSNAVVLPYYNASNPSQAYSGPANAGTTNNTVRKGVCTVAAKAGIAATTGTQTTPAADTGYTGLYVVTVAYGATTVVIGNISTVAGAPFITPTSNYYDVVGGAAGVLTASQLLLEHVSARSLTFPANLAGSYAYAAVAPTSATTITIAVNGTTVATISFAGGATVGTFSTVGGVGFTVSPGQVIKATASSSADATFASPSFTLMGSAA